MVIKVLILGNHDKVPDHLKNAISIILLRSRILKFKKSVYNFLHKRSRSNNVPFSDVKLGTQKIKDLL